MSSIRSQRVALFVARPAADRVAGVATMLLVAGVLLYADARKRPVALGAAEPARLARALRAGRQDHPRPGERDDLGRRGPQDHRLISIPNGSTSISASGCTTISGTTESFVLNADDKPIYAMVDGAARRAVQLTTAATTALEPLVAAAARAAAASAATPQPTRTSPARADLVMIEARPAIASVVPIVSDTGEIEQEPGTEYLPRQRALPRRQLSRSADAGNTCSTGARFAWNDDVGSGRGGVSAGQQRRQRASAISSGSRSVRAGAS